MLSISIISSTPLQKLDFGLFTVQQMVLHYLLYVSLIPHHWDSHSIPRLEVSLGFLWFLGPVEQQQDVGTTWPCQIRRFLQKKKHGLTRDIICGCCFWNWLEGGAIHDATLLNLAATIERWTYTSVTLKGHQSSIKQPQNVQIPAWKLRMGLLPSSSSHDNAFCTYIYIYKYAHDHMHR